MGSEMCIRDRYLISRQNQNVCLKDYDLKLQKGESIHTENSHKYSPESFKNLLLGSGYVDIYDFLHPSNRYGVFVAKRNKQS